MKTIEVTDEQYAFIESLRQGISEQIIGKYGHVRDQDAVQYLIDDFDSDPADLESTIDDAPETTFVAPPADGSALESLEEDIASLEAELESLSDGPGPTARSTGSDDAEQTDLEAIGDRLEAIEQQLGSRADREYVDAQLDALTTVLDDIEASVTDLEADLDTAEPETGERVSYDEETETDDQPADVSSGGSDSREHDAADGDDAEPSDGAAADGDDAEPSDGVDGDATGEPETVGDGGGADGPEAIGDDGGVDGRSEATDGGTTVDPGSGTVDSGPTVGPGSGNADDDDLLDRMMSLLETHDDKWAESPAADYRYRVDLPDGTVEDVQTKDDVRGLLFKHY